MATTSLCIFDRSGSPQLRASLEALGGINIAGECSDWEALQGVLQARRIEVVVVHLDEREIAGGFVLLQQIREVSPECGVIGLSANTQTDTIIRAMRAGCDQFVTMPIDPADLAEALNHARTENGVGADGPTKICVMGASGGAGATTIACNLAIELADLTQSKVALIDMNLEFADVACHFDCQPKCGVCDICKHGIDIDQTLLKSAFHHLDCGVSVLSKPGYPTEAAAVEPDQVSKLFQSLGETFPFIVADLPRNFTPATMAALGEADHVVLITQLAVPFLRNTTRIYEHLLHIGANEEHIDIVLNRTNASYEMITAAEVEDHFGRPIFANVPNDYKRVTTMRDLGCVLINEAPNSPARLGIQDMARKFIDGGQPMNVAEGPAAKSGLLSRFWSRGKARV
ncbi:MAG: response regulator [Phycisphaerae bacterium]